MTSDTPSAPARTALVLGGTSGLGLASARALHAAGSAVTITGRDGERAAAVATDIGPGVGARPLDTADPASVAQLASWAAGAGVDQLVLNGGGPRPGRTRDATADDVLDVLQPLLLAYVQLVRAVLPEMVGRRWGRVVAIGSVSVQAPIPTLALSNIGRAALAAYLKGLAADVAADGVTVNMVLPGRVATARTAALDEAAAAAAGTSAERARAASSSAIPAGRYGEPEEFGAVVAFLCSPAASYVTGEQVRVDGGLVSAY